MPLPVEATQACYNDRRWTLLRRSPSSRRARYAWMNCMEYITIHRARAREMITSLSASARRTPALTHPCEGRLSAGFIGLSPSDDADGVSEARMRKACSPERDHGSRNRDEPPRSTIWPLCSMRHRLNLCSSVPGRLSRYAYELLRVLSARAKR